MLDDSDFDFDDDFDDVLDGVLDGDTLEDLVEDVDGVFVTLLDSSGDSDALGVPVIVAVLVGVPVSDCAGVGESVLESDMVLVSLILGVGLTGGVFVTLSVTLDVLDFETVGV